MTVADVEVVLAKASGENTARDNWTKTSTTTKANRSAAEKMKADRKALATSKKNKRKAKNELGVDNPTIVTPQKNQ